MRPIKLRRGITVYLVDASQNNMVGQPFCGLVSALGYAVLSEYMKKQTIMLVAVWTLGITMTAIAFLPPLPLILAGPLADAAGLHTTFLALSLPMLAVGVIALALPSLRELDRAPVGR